ncbi:beta-ketoacyl-[acyl-carrier-protein] synthase family protein [Streptomyces sp. CB03238]|uniref:beta-ketoacyl-[acyl-carrier-protein] synthase family protein n=1 Tax=Streptomyces sp. CB03238 TaxID=1907777 RepID=UPI001F4E1B67|nr:beta-ketoacyl-[acyl-carrier-protein] synthase family protein [Streptomyces sp. CB03238]
MTRRRVVVTGVGAVTALGTGAALLHDRAVAGESGIEGGEGRCRDFVPEETLTRRERRRMDRCCQLAVVAGQEAVSQAGWGDTPPYRAERVGCIIGTGIGGLESLEQQLDVLRIEGAQDVSALTIPMMMANSVPAQLAIRFGLRGETYSVMSACAGGTQAIGAGVRLIRNGEADAVVVGGAEAGLTDFIRAAFLNAGALSPTGTSVPFSRDRDGFLMGEGAGVLVLEDGDAAAGRGAEVLAEISGYGSTTDAHHLTAPEPTGAAAAQAVRRALEDAGTPEDEVTYINAHGTGTELNDLAEASALAQALGGCLADVPISSTKSAVGHLLGAAGAVEAIATLQALRHRLAPPTAGLHDPDPRLDGLRHLSRACPLGDGADGPVVGISTSFGFGGHNAALVLRA